MTFFNLLWQIIAFAVINIFEQILNAADWIMFTIEDYEVYDNIVKCISFCLGNFYFWQTLATIGFCRYLLRLGKTCPPPSPIIPIVICPSDVGPSIEQLLEDKDASLKDAVSKIDNLDKQNAGLQSKVDRLQKEVDFISKDRYALVREKFVLQNKLGDFNSWPEFRVEYDELATQFEVMKRQRAREHISQEQVLYIAKEAKLELAAAKRAEAMSKIAHSEELKLAKQERDNAMEMYKTLLATNATTTTKATTAASEVVTPGDKVLQEETARLTLALRSKTSLLSKKTSDLERMQSLLKTRSDHPASQLKTAFSKILTLEKEKAKAEDRIAALEKDVQVANVKAEEMEEMYMAVASMDDEEEEEHEEKEEGEEEEKDEKENDDDNEDGYDDDEEEEGDEDNENEEDEEEDSEEDDEDDQE